MQRYITVRILNQNPIRVFVPGLEIIIKVIFFFSSSGLITAQKSNGDTLHSKSDLYQAKSSALEYLGDSLTIRKFGIISDAIWNYAELGMQEFRSSALLIKTLEEEGFNVEKGGSRNANLFCCHMGSGKPVIGILGEYDALPGLSRKL